MPSFGTRLCRCALRPPLETLAIGSVATIDRFVSTARAAGIDGAVIVHHNFPWTKPDVILGIDHEYIHTALERHPTFFKAMGIADPTRGAKMGCVALETLHGLGFSAVRFSGPLFAQVEGGLGGETARSLFARAGELGMPVGLMAFGGFAEALPAVRSLLAASATTKLIIDHFGFCRQAGARQRQSVDALLELARCALPCPAMRTRAPSVLCRLRGFWLRSRGYIIHPLLQCALALCDGACPCSLSRSCPQVYVKASAFMRVSASPYPAAELQPLVRELLSAFGPERLMWGSDFPYALLGQPMPPGAASAPSGEAGLVPYAKVVSAMADWAEPSGTGGSAASSGDGTPLSAEEMRWLMGGTAASLFWQAK